VVGATGEGGRASIAVAPDSTQEVRALVFSREGARPEKATPVTFRIVDVASGEVATTQDHFKAP
jgi:hypothetical protein